MNDLRDVLKHSSTRPNHVYFRNDELIQKSPNPSDENDFSVIQFNSGLVSF